MPSEQNIDNIQHIKKTLQVISLFEIRCQKLREELEFFNKYKKRSKCIGSLIRLNHEVMYLCVDTYSLHEGVSKKRSLYSKIIKDKAAFFSKVDKREHTNPDGFTHLGVFLIKR